MNRLFKRHENGMLHAKWNALTLACMGIFLVPTSANAGLCSDTSSARAGTSKTCTLKRIGSTEVAVPKLVWTKVADSDKLLTPAIQATKFPLQGRETVITGNRSALALGLDSKEATAALQTMPNNTPFVVAKYDPVSAILIIDMLKVEKYVENGVQKVALFSTNFTPEHGNMWAGARSYISPTDRASGMVAGKNPFTAFEGGDNVFHNITVAGAQVAMGHAMRLVGAPTGLFMATNSRIETRQESDSDLLTKKTTIIYEGKVQPNWFIVQPTEFLRGGESTSMSSICVNDINATDCPQYAIATAGVTFEHFKGGMLDMTEEVFELHRESHRGLSMIGSIIVGVLASYAMAYMWGAIQAASAGATAGASGGATGGSMAGASVGTGASTGASTATITNVTTAVEATANSSVLGSLGTMAQNLEMVTGLTTSQGIALEAGAKFATALAMGGSSGSTYNLKPQTFLGHASVQRGYGQASQDDMVRRLRGHTEPRMSGSVTNSGAGNMKGFASTVMGTCDIKSTTQQCISEGKRVGVILRSDQYMEQPLAVFIRENSDSIRRDAYTPFSGGVVID